MTVSADRVRDLMLDVADVAAASDAPTDPAAAQALLDAVETADQELRSLAGRLRIVLAGGEPCGEPPDLAGLCPRCGSRTAPAVAEHQPGCNPFGLLALRVVSAVRWTRLTVRTLRSPATATPQAGGGEAGGSSPEAHSYTELSAPGTHTERGE